jgi:hypothetical protein
MTTRHHALNFPRGPLPCERPPSGYCPDEATMVCHKCGFPVKAQAVPDPPRPLEEKM